MNKKEMESAVKETKTAGKKEVNKETVVYIGPSIKNVVSTGTVYNNGLPARLAAEIEKQPAVKSLLVPVSRLAAVQGELSNQGSAVSLIYEKIKKN